MGGRKSNLEAWFAWAQTLPWWIAFGLAAGLWAGLHVLALGWSLAPSGLPTPIGTIPVRLIVGFVARMLQYLLPAVFVVGGLAGLVLKARRSRVYALASADPVQLVHGMSGGTSSGSSPTRSPVRAIRFRSGEGINPMAVWIWSWCVIESATTCSASNGKPRMWMWRRCEN